MKKLLLLLIGTLLFAEPLLIDGLERASSRYKKDACKMAKSKANRSFNVQYMNLGCSCEISNNRGWMCFISFKHIPNRGQTLSTLNHPAME